MASQDGLGAQTIWSNTVHHRPSDTENEEERAEKRQKRE